MLSITKEQVLERWGNMPTSLREALFSNENSNILIRACESQHLSKDKIGQVGMIMGDILYGFLHPEDFPGEIKKELNINPEIANAIYEEVNRKIFAPIRADLDKVYAPVVPESAVAGFPRQSSTVLVSPENIIDLKSKTEESKEVKPAPSAGALEGAPMSRIEQSGWGQAAPAPITPPPSQREAAPGELQPAAAEEGPVIIHKEESIARPAPLGAQSKRSLGGLLSFLKPKIKAKEEKVKAEIKLGGVADKISGPQPGVVQGKPFDATQGKPRIIHYTELKTPLPPFPVSPPDTSRGGEDKSSGGTAAKPISEQKRTESVTMAQMPKPAPQMVKSEAPPMPISRLAKPEAQPAEPIGRTISAEALKPKTLDALSQAKQGGETPPAPLTPPKPEQTSKPEENDTVIDLRTFAIKKPGDNEKFKNQDEKW